ncbi:DUF523 domain-containing protein [Acinetobacter shaoyimingii]|uniref:DUF523 domain-containing protein n=1 Tax=Acinetobacter shaoyimingii TaxID=2715164 RepID=A0A6G8RZD0_9GAMM|nr:DUF523 domain-containing protein [Acinetobacter shaoyimingii]QIO07299.1 DUF523 domain-containing protein [Acinetobacter shaoyimingii]
MKFLISACLVGHPVRYDGKHCLHSKLKALIKTEQAVVICPEVAGGLSTPRLPAEIVGGDGFDVLQGQAKVLNSIGEDVTQAFLYGAHQALEWAKAHHVTHVILKANSPSCGASLIYDGTFTGQKIQGNGVTSALLKQHGFEVWTEDEFLKALDLHED